MSKIFKILLLSGAVIGLILFFASISVNLYLQSEGVRKQISEAASRAIGKNVTIQSVSFTPWGGITLSKITLANRDASNFPVLLEIGKIRFRAPWLPFLLKRKILLSSVHIEEPIVTIFEPASLPPISASSSQLPVSNPRTINEPIPSVEPLITSQNSPEKPANQKLNELVPQDSLASAPLTASASEPTSQKQSETSAPSNKPSILTTVTKTEHFSTFSPTILISAGKLVFHPYPAALTVVAEGISAKLNPTEAGGFSGPLTCSQIQVSEKIFIKNVHSILSYKANSLEAKPITASLAKGEISGEFHCQLKEQPTFEFKTKVVNASLATLLKESGYDHKGASSGLLCGDLWLFQRADQPNPRGKGSLALLEGQLESADFLRQLGKILQIQELELLHLKKAIASFQIEKNEIVFDDIFLESKNLILKGTGPVKFNGHLDIAAQLLFNDHLYSKYQALMGKELPPSSINGYHEVAFHVSGETSDPQADLLDKLTGIPIQKNIGGILKKFLGWPKTPSASQSRE